MHEGRFDNLDVLRGVAALAVVFAHTVGLSDVAVPAVMKVWQGLFSLAVPMFFALSAFSLAYRYEGRLGSYAELREYALRRFFRIAPLFYFMLAIGIGRSFYKFAHLPSGNELFLNLTFLFGVSPDHYKSLVAAGWSLGVEMMFYAVLPVILLAVRGVGSAALATGLALGAGYAAYEATSVFNSSFKILNFGSCLANFMGGLMAYFAYKKFAKRSPADRQRISWICLGLAAAIWTWVYISPEAFGPGGSYGWRYFVSAAFPLIILSGALGNWGRVVNPVTLRIGLWSYSIYLVHPWVLLNPVPSARHEIYKALDGLPVWVPFTASTILIYVCVIACSYFTYRWIELPGERLGRYLSRPRQPALAPAE